MELAFNRVEKTFQYIDKEVVELELYEKEKIIEALCATNNHPIYIKDKGFIAVKEIRSIDTELAPLLLNKNIASTGLRDGNQDKINKETVYDLTVRDTHTYFVGKSGIWVHNSNGSFIPTGNNHAARSIVNYRSHSLDGLPEGPLNKVAEFLDLDSYYQLAQTGKSLYTKMHALDFVELYKRVMHPYPGAPSKEAMAGFLGRITELDEPLFHWAQVTKRAQEVVVRLDREIAEEQSFLQLSVFRYDTNIFETFGGVRAGQSLDNATLLARWRYGY